MEPGSKERYAMPPFYTPGDGRVVRQGTSLLYKAGEKTRASAPWGHKKNPALPDFFHKNMSGNRNTFSVPVYLPMVRRVEKGRPQAYQVTIASRTECMLREVSMVTEMLPVLRAFRVFSPESP